MPNSDEEDSNSNSNPNPNPNPNNPESRPLLKKSRTIADDRRTPHFPGPLFPAVRRVSTSPPSSHLSSDSDISISNDPLANHGIGFSDRDWMFPSFLGPHAHAARNRVTVKASKSHKHEPSSHSPARSASMPSNLGGARDKVVERRSRTPPASPVPDSKLKPKANKEMKPMPVQVPFSSSLSSSPSSAIPYSPRSRFRNFWIHSLLMFTCTLSVCYAICLQTKVAKLQEENINLHRLYSHKDVVPGSIEDLEPEKESSFSYFGDSDSRTIALYTVLFTLITPFVLYRYLDNLPQIKNLSKRTNNNKEEVPLKKRIAYMVDVCFSVYPYAKLLALLFATMFLIGFGGLALYAVSDGSFAEALWLSWSFVADSGNHADRVGIGPRIVSVSISSGGMLIFAMMLGLVSDAISEKVDSLRKGKSEVIESNHILILGWSDKLGSLLKQLAIANKSLGGGVVVVLAERDKEEMEMDIAKLEFDFMGTSVICRSGSPLILADLKKVSVSKARAIIVLASDEIADQSDARALRVVLSLTGVKEGLRGHVVVEMSDLDNEPLVKLVGGELIETVVAHDVIGRLMIQCALQPGLAQEWPKGSLEETVQNAVKSWEMELSHKTRTQDFKTINPEKFRLIVNGRESLSAEETLRLGSYNALLKNSLPEEFKYYKAEEESFESSHDAFRSAFPRGFAWEVISVHSGPPLIAYKFRHWGFFEGPFKGHAPTGDMVQFIGMGILKVDESLKAEDVEVYYDPAELFGGLLKGPPISVSDTTATSTHHCPFHK